MGDGRISHSRRRRTACSSRSGSKQALELFRTRYPRIKAAVYWHERWQNADQSYSNLRVNSSVESLKAYREGVASPNWIGRFDPKRPKSAVTGDMSDEIKFPDDLLLNEPNRGARLIQEFYEQYHEPKRERGNYRKSGTQHEEIKAAFYRRWA